MSTAAFTALVAVLALPVGAVVVPALAAWAPGVPTPVRQRGWVVGQAVATVAGVAVVAAGVGSGWRAVPLVALVPVLVALSAADLATRRLPDRLVGPTIGILFAVLAVTALAAGEPGWLGGAVVGAVLLGGVLFAVHVVSPAGMGFGDVKFGVVLGAALGWVHPLLALVGLLIGSVLGAVAGVVLAVARRDRKVTVPFGPFLAAGTVIALLAG